MQYMAKGQNITGHTFCAPHEKSQFVWSFKTCCIRKSFLAARQNFQNLFDQSHYQNLDSNGSEAKLNSAIHPNEDHDHVLASFPDFSQHYRRNWSDKYQAKVVLLRKMPHPPNRQKYCFKKHAVAKTIIDRHKKVFFDSSQTIHCNCAKRRYR